MAIDDGAGHVVREVLHIAVLVYKHGNVDAFLVPAKGLCDAGEDGRKMNDVKAAGIYLGGKAFQVQFIGPLNVHGIVEAAGVHGQHAKGVFGVFFFRVMGHVLL